MLPDTQKLFSDFPPSDFKDWKKQLEKDLKEASFESLTWKNENGFDVAPYYTREDLKTDYEPVFTHHEWDISVEGKESDPEALNRFFLKYLNRGATSIALNIAGLDLKKVLKNIGLEFIHATFYCTPQCPVKLQAFLEENYDLPKLHISLLPASLNSREEFKTWVKSVDIFRKSGFSKTTTANVLSFHNRNCSASLEVALALSQLTEYLEEKALGIKAVVVKMGVNSDYFVQIAKFRALRRLWNLLKKEYKIENSLYLIVENAGYNKSVLDPHTNLLRSTVEAMAAVAGGCNELVINKFDLGVNKDSDFSQRLAVNQQLVLREEAYMNKMADVSCGSYYIESLTDLIAEKALVHFKEIEKAGGYFTCLEQKIIDKKLQESEDQFRADLQSGTKVLVGVNKYTTPAKNGKPDPAALQSNLVADYEVRQQKDTSNA